MSDLISRSALIKRLKQWNTNDEMDKALYNFAMNRVIEQPTAYDVDKVVKKFEEQYGVKKYEDDVLVAYEQAYIHIDEAIEIVKRGGMND